MKKILSLLLCGFICFVIWATIGAACENIKINNEVNKFISNATLIEEKSTSSFKYYEVKSEEELDLPTYIERGNRTYLGNTGDLICAKMAAVEIPIIYEGITFYVGGHAALVGMPYSSDDINFRNGETLEINGFGDDITARTVDSYYFNNGYYKEYVVYRVNTSLENRKKAFINALSYYGQEYNYTFIFNQRNKKYCSDIAEKAYHAVGINLNYDGCATTVLDVMASPYLSIIGYSKLDENNVRHTYVLV